MKKKKQTRKIKQWLAAALGLTLLGTGLWIGKSEEKLQAKPIKSAATTRAYPSATFTHVQYEQYSYNRTLSAHFTASMMATGKIEGNPRERMVFFQTSGIPTVPGIIGGTLSTARTLLRSDDTFRVHANSGETYDQSVSDYLYMVDIDQGLSNEDYYYYSNGRIYTNNTNTPNPIIFTSQLGPQNPVKVTKVNRKDAQANFTVLGGNPDNGTSYFQYRDMIEDPHSSETGELYWEQTDALDFSGDSTNAIMTDLSPGWWYEVRWMGQQYGAEVPMPTSVTRFVTLLDFSNLSTKGLTKSSATMTGNVEGYLWKENGIQVQYRKKGETVWVDGVKTTDIDSNSQNNSFELTQTQLEVNTVYEYRIVSYNRNADWNGRGVACYSPIKEFQTLEEEPWLPYYKPNQIGGWLDSEKNVIPKENAFALQYLQGNNGTKPVAKSADIQYTELGLDPFTMKESEDYLKLPFNGKRQWMAFENAGYYKGKKVGVLVSINAPAIPENSPYTKYGAIGWKNDKFLDIAIPVHFKEEVDVSFEFFDSSYPVSDTGILSEEMKLFISGYWYFNGINSAKELTLPLDFKNIYSTSREYSDPIDLQYKETDAGLEIFGFKNADLEKSHQKVTITYNELSVLKFKVKSNVSGGQPNNLYGVYFSQSTDVKVEVPDPMQGEPQVYNQIIQQSVNDKSQVKGIIENKIENLNYGFIQPIPYEAYKPFNNRNQSFNWHITDPTGAEIVKPKSWKVSSLDEGVDRTDYFELGDLTDISPSAKADIHSETSAFYNHYYNFRSDLEIDYKKKVSGLDKKIVDGKTNAAYLGMADGNAQLKVQDDHPPTGGLIPGKSEYGGSADFATKINFYAPLEYKYVNSVTGKEIPAGSLPTSAKPVGDGIVTWEAPLTPQQLTDESYTQDTGQGEAPVIAGYAFDHSELNGSETETQIKVTKLLRKKTQAEEAAGQTVDDTNPANYTQNNVVTLYYTPLTYQVGITVKDSKEGEVLSPTETNPSAETHFLAAVVASKGKDGWEPVAKIDWQPLSKIDFTALDKQYQIKQVSLVKEGYDWDKVTNGSPSNPSPKFWVELATNELATNNETTEYQVKLETGYTHSPPDPYTNHGYLFPEKLTVSGEGATQTRALPLTVINKPIGELKLPALDPIHFGTDQIEDKDGKTIEGVSLPRSTEKTMIQRSSTSTNWKIKVEDERLEPYQTGGWRLEATMTKDFTWTDSTDPTRKSVISNILVFCPTDKTFAEVAATPMGVGSTVEIKEFDTGTKEMTWAAEKGFLLKVDQAKQNEIMAKGTDGNKYEAELEFVLTADPLSEPGK